MLRHTHATELIRAGWDASYVQKRLGHAHVQTTLTTYIHLTDEDLSQRWRAYQEGQHDGTRSPHEREDPPPSKASQQQDYRDEVVYDGAHGAPES